MTTKLTDTQIQAILDGCKGVTPWPWHTSGELNQKESTISIHAAAWPDGGKRVIADVFAWPDDVYQNASHIARCDPQFIAAAMTELIEQRKGDATDQQSVKEQIDSGGGYWHSCSGCHESVDGYSIGLPSPIFQCHVGSGCHECGGIGVKWDDTDYSQIGQAALSGDSAIVEACAKVARDIGERHDKVVQALFKKEGEWAARSARDAAYDIEEAILAMDISPPASLLALTREQMAEQADIESVMNTGKELHAELIQFADAILTAQRGVAVTPAQRGGEV